ncbi:hypothetical protein DFJ74DRAFT_672460 [Hyaloraphidium curvatum]|nr:hypothetical protein DFJ74DRAFT_672460 [Hyaloraphidium curvatum]
MAAAAATLSPAAVPDVPPVDVLGDEDDEVLELYTAEPKSVVGRLWDAAGSLVGGAMRMAGFGKVQGAETLQELAERKYNEMMARVKAHFRRAILSFPVDLDYPVFQLAQGGANGGISMYDVLPAALQPDDPLAERMKSIESTSTLLWLLDRVIPVTSWAVQMITAVPKRLAQVLVVDMALMREAASRSAFKAIVAYKQLTGAEGGEAKNEVKAAEEEKAPAHEAPRDITALIDTGSVDDAWTDELTAHFAGPKHMFSDVYMGVPWADTADGRRGLAVQKVLNDLQFGKAAYAYAPAGKPAAELKTVDDFVGLLKTLGFRPSTYLNVRIADFLDLHTIKGLEPPAEGASPRKTDWAKIDIKDIVTPVLVLIHGEDKKAKPYLFPCMHSEWHLVWTHPKGAFNLGTRFFHDMFAGAQFHPRNAWGLPCWIQNREFLERSSWEDLDKVLARARLYIENITKLDLGPNGGYGLVGVCQDSAAFVEHGVYGTITPPLISGEPGARKWVVGKEPALADLLALPDDVEPSHDHLVRLAASFPRICGGVRVLEDTRDRLVKEGFKVPEDVMPKAAATGEAAP